MKRAHTLFATVEAMAPGHDATRPPGRGGLPRRGLPGLLPEGVAPAALCAACARRPGRRRCRGDRRPGALRLVPAPRHRGRRPGAAGGLDGPVPRRPLLAARLSRAAWPHAARRYRGPGRSRPRARDGGHPSRRGPGHPSGHARLPPGAARLPGRHQRGPDHVPAQSLHAPVDADRVRAGVEQPAGAGPSGAAAAAPCLSHGADRQPRGRGVPALGPEGLLGHDLLARRRRAGADGRRLPGSLRRVGLRAAGAVRPPRHDHHALRLSVPRQRAAGVGGHARVHRRVPAGLLRR